MLAVCPSPCFGGQHPPEGREEKLNGLDRWESICLGNKGELRSGDKRRRANSWLLVHHPCKSLGRTCLRIPFDSGKGCLVPSLAHEFHKKLTFSFFFSLLSSSSPRLDLSFALEIKPHYAKKEISSLLP